MSNSPVSKPPVLVIAAVQLLLVSLAGIALHYGGKPVTALSVVIGGALCALPNAYFGLRAFRGGPQPCGEKPQQRGARAASRVLENFYRGEVGKFVLTFVGFAAIFAVVKPLNPVALFVSYGLCVIVQWLLAASSVR